MVYLKRWSRSPDTLSFIIGVFLLALSISCKGQETETSQSAPKRINHSSTQSQPMLDMRADPMRPVTNVRIDDFYPGQLCHWVRNIVEDQQGNLWFGTNHFGVMRYNGQRLDYFGQEQGFPGTRVTGMLVDHDGSVWFASSDGLVKFQDERFTTFTTANGLPSDYTWSLLLDDKEQLWVGTQNGLCIFDGEKCIPFDYPKAPVNNPEVMVSPDRVSGLMQDDSGRVWISTDGQGITIYDGVHFSFLTKADGLTDDNISEMFQAFDGRIWIGSMLGGMSIYDGRTFTPITIEDGVLGDESAAIYQDKDGSIWFSSEGHGVYRYNGKKFEQYYKKQGLISGGIIRIFRDSKDRFWFGGWKGLFRLQEGQFTPVTRKGPWNED